MEANVWGEVLSDDREYRLWRAAYLSAWSRANRRLLTEGPFPEWVLHMLYNDAISDCAYGPPAD